MSVLTYEGMKAAWIRGKQVGCYGEHPFQAAHQEPPASRPWRHRAGHFVITGFTGRTRSVKDGHLDEFRLPSGEQVPCLNLGRYGCQHWVSEGWMSPESGLVFCPACASPEESPCGC